jgi:hypothetical protein
VRIAADEQLSDRHSRRRLNDLAKFVTGEFLEIGAGGDDRAGAGVLEEIDPVANGDRRAVDLAELAAGGQRFAAEAARGKYSTSSGGGW